MSPEAKLMALYYGAIIITFVWGFIEGMAYAKRKHL